MTSARDVMEGAKPRSAFFEAPTPPGAKSLGSKRLTRASCGSGSSARKQLNARVAAKNTAASVSESSSSSSSWSSRSSSFVAFVAFRPSPSLGTRSARCSRNSTSEPATSASEVTAARAVSAERSAFVLVKRESPPPLVSSSSAASTSAASAPTSRSYRTSGTGSIRRAFARRSASSRVRSCSRTAVSTRVSSSASRKKDAFVFFFPPSPSLVEAPEKRGSAPAPSASEHNHAGPVRSTHAAHRSSATCLSSRGAFAPRTEATPPRTSSSQSEEKLFVVLRAGVAPAAALASSAVSLPCGLRAGSAESTSDKHRSASICSGWPGREANAYAREGAARATARAAFDSRSVRVFFLHRLGLGLGRRRARRPSARRRPRRRRLRSTPPSAGPHSLCRARGRARGRTPRATPGASPAGASRRAGERSVGVGVGARGPSAPAAAASTTAAAAAATTPASAATRAMGSPPAATTRVAASHASATAARGSAA